MLVPLFFLPSRQMTVAQRANDDEEEDSLPANTTQFGSVKMRAVAGTKRVSSLSFLVHRS